MLHFPRVEEEKVDLIRELSTEKAHSEVLQQRYGGLQKSHQTLRKEYLELTSTIQRRYICTFVFCTQINCAWLMK